MDELRQEMTFDEFVVYPRKLGWKYEYFGGAHHLSPYWTAVATFQISPNELLQLSTAPAMRALAQHWANQRDRLDPWPDRVDN